MRVCYHGYITGKVQGVYYRQTTLEQAQTLGLDGWVKNLADGRVEVLFEGPQGAVTELAEWLKQGPVDARVDVVELTEQPLQNLKGFVIQR